MPKKPRKAVTVSRGIQRLPSGSFRVRVTDGTGKMQELTVENYELAEKIRAALLADRLSQKHRLPSSLIVRERPSLRTVLSEHLATQERRHAAGETETNTIDFQRRKIETLLLWVEVGLRQPSFAAEELTQDHILQFVHWRRYGGHPNSTATADRPLKDQTIKHDLVELRRACAESRIDVRWKIPSFRPSEPKRILEPHELRAFMNAMPMGSIERTVCEVALRTGLRVCDVEALKTTDLDLQRGLLKKFVARKTRRQKPHNQPKALSPRLVEILSAYLAGPEYIDNTERRLFSRPARGGGALPLSKNSLTYRLAQASRRAGIDPPIKSYGVMRNHFAAYMTDLGIGDIILSQMMGHSNTSQTRKYGEHRPPMAAMGQAANLLDGLIDDEN